MTILITYELWIIDVLKDIHIRQLQHSAQYYVFYSFIYAAHSYG